MNKKRERLFNVFGGKKKEGYNYKKEGNKFHKKLEKILHRSGFKILKSDFNDKGPDIIIQIDNKKIIVQCRHSPIGNYYNKLEDEVDSYSNKIKKYNAYRAVIALSGYKIKMIDQKRLARWLESDKVAVWTDTIINNYDSLSQSIGEYARYQIAADLDINYKFREDLKIPAIHITQNKTSFYITKLKPSFLLQASYVARRAQNPEFYQRYLSKKRVKNQIPDFIEHKKGILPNSLIFVSKYKLDFDNNKLILPGNNSYLWVIDGQHRLYSFSNIKNKKINEDYELVCTIFDSNKITPTLQADMFLQINTQAKKVPPPLITEITETLGSEFIPERSIFLLKKMRKTPYFEGKIKGYNGKGGSIDNTTFCRNVAFDELTKDGGIILRGKSKLSENRKNQLCYNYFYTFFKILCNNFRNEWKDSDDYILSTNQGYRSLLRLFIKILRYTGHKKDSKKFKEVIKAFKKSKPLIKNQDIKGQFAGEGGAARLADEWAMGINNVISGFDKTVEKNYGNQIGSKRIYKGDIKEAEEFIVYYSEKFNGTLRGELAFIDITTLDYIEEYFKNCNKIHIIYSNMRSEDKIKIDRKLKHLKEQKSEIVLTKVEKVHERWLADDKYLIDLKADLKKDGLANSEHEIAIFRFDKDKDKIIDFDNRWNYLKAYNGRKFLYDWTIEKENENHP